MPVSIKISPVEGVIEGFWNPALQSIRRWETRGGKLSGFWCANFLSFGGNQPGATASITRAYDLDLGDYQRLVLRLYPGAAVRTTITAMVDGQEQTIVRDAAGSNQPLELSGPIHGKKLTRLTVQLKAQKPGSYSVQLNWVLLDKPGASWTPPAAPFDGMIVEVHHCPEKALCDGPQALTDQMFTDLMVQAKKVLAAVGKQNF